MILFEIIKKKIQKNVQKLISLKLKKYFSKIIKNLYFLISNLKKNFQKPSKISIFLNSN